MKITKLRRYGLLAMSAMVFGTMAMISGCAGDEEKAGTKFTLGTIAQVDSKLYHGAFEDALINDDKTMAYVKNTRGEIFSIVLKNGVKDINDQKNWKQLTLKDPTKDGNAGKAKLDLAEANPAVRKMILTKKGLIVIAQMQTAAPANVGALAYFVGDVTVPTYAWTSVGAPANTLNATDYWTNAKLVVSGEKEFIIIESTGTTGNGGHPEASSVEVGAFPLAGQYRKTTNFVGGAVPHIVDGKDDVYFVSVSGIVVLKKSDIGTVKAMADEVVNSEEESAKWVMLAGTPNNTILQTEFFNDKIYFTLNATGPNTGGIVIYDTDKKKTTAPRQDVWSNIKIDDLFVSDGKVNVVLDNGLFELNDDTGLGKILFSTQTMANNKFSAKLLKVGEDIGEKTLYRWSAFPATVLKMRLIGNDIILVTNIVVRNLIIKALDTITYEERTVGSFKGETEKSGSTGTSGSNP